MVCPGGVEGEQVTLERLDQAAAALEAVGPGEVARVRADQEASWQSRFEMLLEGMSGEEQQRAADELRDLLAGFAGGRAAAVGQGAVAVAGDVDIHAETGGAAAWQMGNVQIGHPPGAPAWPAGASTDPHQPGRSRG